ncbi:hypothetical protein [Pelagibius sp. Alg239-R121]|uniref:hypothetical protein n=1 Tax=Pelagibius sp. Alg239-R121 TaxID=2993448 RepID=UPI0024A7900A|nr:hypothetical protein [Pelagibius sp. Alg239-R121]
MKKYLIPFAFAVSMAAPVGSSHAQGIPTYDNANNLNMILDKIEQVKQLAELQAQYQQLVQNYQQAVANATRLQDMVELTELYDLADHIVHADVTKLILNQIHGLDPNSITYANDAKRLLQDQYGIPATDSGIRERIGKVVAPDVAERIGDKMSRTQRDFNFSVAKSKTITAAKDRTSDVQQLFPEYQSRLAGMGDNSLAATTQLMADQDQTAMVQRDIMLGLLIVQAQAQEEEEIRRLEREVKRMETFVSRLEAKKKFQTEPINMRSERIIE